LPADLKLTSYEVGSGNGDVFYGGVMMPFNGTQNLHGLINQPYVGTGSGNIYGNMGINDSPYPQNGPVVVLVVVVQQNSTYAYIQPPINAPGARWIG